jgi:hypothetical protein
VLQQEMFSCVKTVDFKAVKPPAPPTFEKQFKVNFSITGPLGGSNDDQAP